MCCGLLGVNGAAGKVGLKYNQPTPRKPRKRKFEGGYSQKLNNDQKIKLRKLFNKEQRPRGSAMTEAASFAYACAVDELSERQISKISTWYSNERRRCRQNRD